MMTVDLRVSEAQMERAIRELGDYVAIHSVSNPESPDYAMELLEAAAQFAHTCLEDLDFEVRQVCIELDFVHF